MTPRGRSPTKIGHPPYGSDPHFRGLVSVVRKVFLKAKRDPSPPPHSRPPNAGEIAPAAGKHLAAADAAPSPTQTLFPAPRDAPAGRRRERSRELSQPDRGPRQGAGSPRAGLGVPRLLLAGARAAPLQCSGARRSARPAARQGQGEPPPRAAPHSPPAAGAARSSRLPWRVPVSGSRGPESQDPALTSWAEPAPLLLLLPRCN